ncbi:Pol Polyprotein [Phytophthora cinnamomi]|uniref:Pol Polyprotein n=1 Tax=Phytophthora cinnamomi TaxID=4785 RepID=UPI003559D41F|nr:Pol Polyprotein [Phytophthora cinnamomi]
MDRRKKDEYVTYTLVITPATAETPAETAQLKIKKFGGGSARDWLKWSGKFRSLARKKQWTDEQKAHNLVALIEGDLEADVESAAQDAVAGNKTFEEFFTDVGFLSVPHDFSEDLDNELWTMTKRRDESVHKFSQRMRENIRMFAELPQDAEVIPEVRQCRYFKRGMPRAWQEKLAASGAVYDRLNDLVLYFTRIEKAERQLATRDKSKSFKDPRKDYRKEKHQAREVPLKNRYKSDKKKPGQAGSSRKEEKWCSFHKTSSHNTSECYTVKKKEADEHKRTEAPHPPKHNKTKQYPRIYKNLDAESDSEESSDDEMKFVDLVDKEVKNSQGAPLRIAVKLRRSRESFQALLDSGASKSVINKTTLDANVQLGRKLIPASPTVFNTMSGKVNSNGTTVAQFLFPQLKADTIITHRFEVIDDSSDAMIIGRDIMNELGLILNFKDRVVQWEDCFLSLNTGRSTTKPDTDKQDDLEFPEEAKEAADNAVKPEELLPEHLQGKLAANYLALLTAYQTLYDGHLGRMKFDDYELALAPDFKPAHAKPYPIARSQEQKAKDKIQQLINDDVLEQIYDSEMASPAFFLSKPDGSLCLLVDFRWLNKYLRRSPYYVPRIREILMRLASAKCLSTFDANLGYYARRLAKTSRHLTAFCLPFGKFRYKRLPMGICTAPDEYQASMERILGDLNFVVVYLDDILVFSQNEEEHLEHLRIVFKRLEKYGVSLNGGKCRVLRKDVEYLGYTLSAEGIRPQAKKIQAIQKIAVPRNRKELRRFLGMINYYRDMVPNKTTLCKPLHRFTSTKVPFTWLPIRKPSGPSSGPLLKL